MSAFQQALAASLPPQPQASTSNMNIRGSGSVQAPGTASLRVFGTATRQAGINKDSMEVDGEAGRPVRGRVERRGARSGGPLDQSGRNRPSNIPYAKPVDRNGGPRPPGTLPPTGPAATLSSRLSRPQINPKGQPGRQPQATPPMLQQDRSEAKRAQNAAHSKLNEKLGGEEMKQWLRSRLIGEGIMDMSGLPNDPWLKEQGILPPSDVNAPQATGSILWKLIDNVIQRPTNTPIHTLSLSKNGFVNLNQLDRLAFNLPHLRALDLSNNPIRQINELDHLLAQGEKRGKATAGVGSLKSLIELKLNDCTFRERMLAPEKGAETYQRETLRRFPGLLILDGVNLNRIVFDVERKPIVKRTQEERAQLAAVPFSFPVDVQGGFMESEIVQNFVMQFCAKYFPLFDTDRTQLFAAYSPKATISASANTLISRSSLSVEVAKTRHTRPPQAGFNDWVKLPGRNLLRNATTTEQRMSTLKSPMNAGDLGNWWSRKLPVTKHPLEEASKWCIDAWVLDGEGVDTKLCAMIQGEFEEMPSGSFRSFSRTFILADAPQGSPAQQAGWPATILSDTLIVHSYMSSGAFGPNKSLITNGVTIVPPAPPAMTNDQSQLIARLRAQTRMNEQFAIMCLEQNGWGYEAALANFEAIKGSIPAEAFA